MGKHNTVCPYCHHDITLIDGVSTTTRDLYFNFDSCIGMPVGFKIMVAVCPNPECKKIISFAYFYKTNENNTYASALSETVDRSCAKCYPAYKDDEEYEPALPFMPIPISRAKTLPEYVPEAVRNDFNEAHQILLFSPKASATLARRCLQGMIRDFWGITKNRLVDEIAELKAKVEPEVWDAIEAVRTTGNIGAHMEKDVNVIVDIDKDEAETILGLIEMLIEEWYVNRYNREERLQKVKAIGVAKKAEKTQS